MTRGSALSRAGVAKGKNKPDKPAPPWLAANIKRHRERLGISQAELAARSGQTSVKLIETAGRWGSVSALGAIATALGVEIPDLLANPDEPNPPELDAFLRTPEAVELRITNEERELLRAVRVPGRRPDPMTYYWEMKKIRSMKPADDAERAGTTPTEASPVAHAPKRRRLGGGGGSGT